MQHAALFATMGRVRMFGERREVWCATGAAEHGFFSSHRVDFFARRAKKSTRWELCQSVPQRIAHHRLTPVSQAYGPIDARRDDQLQWECHAPPFGEGRMAMPQITIATVRPPLDLYERRAASAPAISIPVDDSEAALRFCRQLAALAQAPADLGAASEWAGANGAAHLADRSDARTGL